MAMGGCDGHEGDTAKFLHQNGATAAILRVLISEKGTQINHDRHLFNVSL